MIKKHGMKFLIAFLATIMITISPVHAVQSCKDITYYSRKDYVTHENLVDVNFTENNIEISNTIAIPFSIDAFGPLAFPERVSSQVLIGPEIKEFKSDGKEQYFHFRLGAPIKLKQLDSKVYAINKDGSYASYKIYANSYYTYEGFTMGPQIGSGSGNGNVHLDFGDGYELDSIMIRFDHPENIATYVVDNFQITEYANYEHVEWVDYYIANTETKTERYCITDGKFDPDGTTVWEDMVLTTFTAKADAIFTYAPEKMYEDPWSALDYDKHLSHTAYSMPNLKSSSLSPAHAKNIAGYKHVSGNMYNAVDKNGSKYIYSDDGTTAVEYQINLRYWTPGGSASDAIPGWFSSDAAWCADATGQWIGACVKHEGHHSNARYNTYDITLVYYRAVANDLQQVATTTYTLNEYSRNNRSIILENSTSLGSVTGETTKDFLLDDTGIYKIIASIKDKAGNNTTRTSNFFYIDNEVPEITFEEDPLDGGWYIDDINVKTTIKDNYSGVNNVYRTIYASKTGEEWVAISNFDERVYNYGITNQKVDLDTKQKIELNIPISVSKEFRYYKISVTAEDVFGNTLTSESPVYRYDNINPTIEIIDYSPERFLDDGSLNWTNQDVTITVKVTDNESGLSELYITQGMTKIQNLKKYNGESESVNYFTFTTNIEEYKNYDLTIYDRANNSASTDLIIDTIDKVPPYIAGGLVCGQTFVGEDQIKLEFKDSLSGVEYFEYRTIYRNSWGEITGTDWIRIDGDFTSIYIPESAVISLEVRGYDRAGNVFALDNCSYEIQHIFTSEIALVDYDYIFGLYDDTFGDNAIVTDDIADQFMEMLEADTNDASKTCVRFVKDKVKNDDMTKAEALNLFFDIFMYNQKYIKNSF